jgi:pimeloyl-ACP methyl ester carboxylesterase
MVDLRAAFDLHLYENATAKFMGGRPDQVPERYAEADPMTLPVVQAKQWLIHGTEDEVVPNDFSRRCVELKKKRGEDVQLVEVPKCGHFDLIDPHGEPWKEVLAVVEAA